MQNILLVFYFLATEEVPPIAQQQQDFTGTIQVHPQEDEHSNQSILPNPTRNDDRIPEDDSTTGNAHHIVQINSVTDDDVIVIENFSPAPQNVSAKCTVCAVEATYAWVPCGHLCLCGPCKNSWRTTESKRSCPMCRASLPIYQVEEEISYIIQEPFFVRKYNPDTNGNAVCIKCSSEATIAWVPCGHICLCERCRNVWRNDEGNSTCPVCTTSLPEVNIDDVNRQVVQEPLFIYQYE